LPQAGATLADIWKSGKALLQHAQFREAHIDLRLLKYFIAIVDMGSLTKAASLVHVAQPALSQAVTALEQELKVTLLLRSSRGVTPTPAGKTLYRHAVSITRQVEAARFDISAPRTDREEAGDVAVGIPPTLVPLVGFTLFSRLRSEYPRIRLHLSESSGGQLGELLLRGHLDMMLTFRERAPSRTLLVPVLEETLFLVEKKSSKIRGETVSTAALENVPLVLPSAVHGIREVIEDAFAVDGLEPFVLADIDSVDVLFQIAKSGLASAILPSTCLLSREEGLTIRQLAPQVSRRISLLTFDARKQSSTALTVQRVLTDLMHTAVRNGSVRGAKILDAA